MKTFLFNICTVIILSIHVSAIAGDTLNIPINRIFYTAESKFCSMTNFLNNPKLYPRSINSDGSVRVVSANECDWTIGFFPGSLWYMYENTHKEIFENYAKNWTADIESQKNSTVTHDLGFMFYCSFGNGLRLSSQDNYAHILLTAANSLITRYNSNVGCIRSWDFGTWEFPVIIDNMMNLELLFWATHYTGDSIYYNIAVNHAKTTLKNHFRNDNSSYHVVNYNKTTGEVISKSTRQGYSDESNWARGQAWGLYGFTMCYRETKDTTFLIQAEKIADFYIKNPNMPKDLIPYWDLLDPEILTNPDNAPRDASAAAVASSGLIELSGFSHKKDRYLAFAESTLYSLSSSEYLTDLSSSNNFILLKSTGNKPDNSEVNTSLNYADYYFLESLTRYRSITNANFESYIVSFDTRRASINKITTDTISIYDLDSNGGFTVSLKGNPEFIQLQKLDNNNYTLIANPLTNNIGVYNFVITVSDDDDNTTNKKIVYTVN